MKFNYDTVVKNAIIHSHLGTKYEKYLNSSVEHLMCEMHLIVNKKYNLLFEKLQNNINFSKSLFVLRSSMCRFSDLSKQQFILLIPTVLRNAKLRPNGVVKCTFEKQLFRLFCNYQFSFQCLHLTVDTATRQER